MYQTDQYEGMLAETVSVHGHNGDVVNAYLARPMGTGPFPAMVVIHHAPGWDEWYREATRRYAHHGYVAISPNLYSRDGHGTPEDIGAAVRAAGGVPDDQMVGDVTGAMKYLRSQAYINGKVGLFGTCSGGRNTFLTVCQSSGFDAAIECWGGRVVMAEADLNPKNPVAPIDLHQGPVLPAVGVVRERRCQPFARAGEPARGGAEEARQELRVPPLRRRGPRLLLLPHPSLPPRAGRGRLAENLGLPREDPRLAVGSNLRESQP